jgi:predicted Zn-dependent protease
MLLGMVWLMTAEPAFTSSEQEKILEIAKQELDRNFKILSKSDIPVYFIGYQIYDLEETTISATFGNLLTTRQDRQRLLDTDLRVGDYGFDNTHIIRGQAINFGGGSGIAQLPYENDPLAIKQALWLATDKSYKSAVETYQKAKANQLVKVEEEDTSDDLSRVEPVQDVVDVKFAEGDVSKIEGMVKRLSAMFKGNAEIYSGDVTFKMDNVTKYYISSEGAKVSWDEQFVRLFVSGYTKSDDGMSLPLFESYFAFTIDELPSEKEIASDIDSMIGKLKSLRQAPVMGTFTGPAVLSGEAAGVFFHEIFGHRVEGHREKDPNSSQTFKQSVGEDIFPEFISVIFDPTIKTYDDTYVSGYYQYDDEGVPGEKVVSVENGIFKSFLMSRMPIEDFPESNGHGRKQPGYKAVARQSNLIVKVGESGKTNDIFEDLRLEAKKQGLEYGIYFAKVQGGFTFTSRTIPNAFNVQPIEVYKVFADGRPNELVRGVDLIGTPLTVFKKILSGNEDIETFNGICGAESGGVPVSASSPYLLIESIEIQKKRKSQAKPPLLPSPVAKGGAK